MRGKWVLLCVSAILVAIAAGALSVLRRPAVEAKKAAPAPPPALPPGAEISLAGKIEADHVIPVPAPIDGIIEEYLVDVGEEVYEGQLLARLRNQALEGASELAKIELDRAETRVNNLDSSLISARLEASRARAESSRSKGEFE